MKLRFLLFFILLTTLSLSATNKNAKVYSPDGKLCVKLYSDGENNRLFYEITKNTEVLLEKSAFGVIKDGADLGEGINIGNYKSQQGTDKFNMFGNHTNVKLKYNEAIIPISTNSYAYDLMVRVYNNGVALKSKLNNKASCRIDGESLEWKLPDNTEIWYQNNLSCYEGEFMHECTDTIKTNTVIGLPVTAKTSNGKYILLTEADVVNYSDMALVTTPQQTLKSFFHADKNGWNTGANTEQPWRVVIVADNLNELVNNDIIYSLASAPTINFDKEKWIKPGRSTWQWWSSGDPKLHEQDEWIDWTAQMGFEYYLIDDGWKVWKREGRNEWECLKDVVDKAKSKNVNVWLWVHSNEVDTPEKRIEYFKKVTDAGIVGIKIDFMPPASQKWINWYEETMQDAFNYKLMVDFHGSVKPSGRNRTWPNEMTREGVRGHEWHIRRYNRTLAPSHDCILPFNRYVQGFADYTPTVFNPKELRGYTWSREIAQAIIFTSPFLCYADKPTFYLENESVDLLKKIPAVWDETIVLPCSNIGKCAAFARRKGSTWFVAVMNGSENREIEIDFSFLKKGKKYEFEALHDSKEKENAFIKETGSIEKDQSIKLSIKPAGGFVGIYQINK